MPTKEEAEALKAEFANREFPKSIPATGANAEAQRIKLGLSSDVWFEIRSQRNRSEIILCRQRIETEHGKIYVPWTRFSDGHWRNMEPDIELLPLWKPKVTRNKCKVMIHEGEKVARFVDGLVNDIKRKKELAAHPWAAELAEYEHWGWIGGAPNPHRTDWSEVTTENPTAVTIVADRDLVGERAIKPIVNALKSLKAPMSVVMFPDAFNESFDLADPFPESFQIKGRYRGPSLEALSRSATWATRAVLARVKKNGEPEYVYVARDEFLKKWVRSIKPLVFVNRLKPSRYLDDEQFNAITAPFSDIKNTAEVLRAEIVTQVDSLRHLSRRPRMN